MQTSDSQRNYTKFAIVAFWTLFLVGCGPNGCSGGGSALPPAPTPTPSQVLYVDESGLNQVQSLDSTSGQPRATIHVGKDPIAMSFDRWTTSASIGPSIWVANSGANSVSRISTLTNTVVATIPVGSDPVSIASDELWAQGTVWVANAGDDTLSIIDKFTNTVKETIHTAGRPFQLVPGVHFIAIAESNDTVEILDAVSNTIIGTIKLSAPIAGVAIDPGSDAVVETSDGVLHLYTQSVSDSTGWPWSPSFTMTLPDGAGPLSESDVGGAQIWIVASQSKGTVQILESTGALGGLRSLQGTMQINPVGLAPEFAQRSIRTSDVYVANAGGNSITVIGDSIGNQKVIGTWALASGAVPYDVAFADQASVASPSPAPTASPTPTPSPTSTPAAIAHMYVANGSGKNVLEYTAPFSASSAPSVTVNIGANVWGIAVDSSYVAVEDSTGFIYIFNAPLAANASPVAQFQGPANGANLLFDSNGNLYTGTQGAGVLEYSPPFSNSSTPSKTITGDSSSFSLAMDMISNTLYVGNLGMNQIDVFASPYTGAPTSVTSPGTYSLATQGATLYGADAMSNAIDAYNLPMNGSSTPAYIITATNPHALAFDNSDGTLYVGDQNGSIDAFAQPLGASSTKAFSFTNGVVEPVEIAIDN